jgi:predicted SprT family Zn-dependent metalloprotease
VVDKADNSWDLVKVVSKKLALHHLQQQQHQQQQQQQQWALCMQPVQAAGLEATHLSAVLSAVLFAVYCCCSGCSGAEQGWQQAADNLGQPAWGAQAGEGFE